MVYRTSETSRRLFLQADCERRCKKSPLVGEVYRRTSALLRLPPRNFESMEFLHYKPGQHYVPRWGAREFRLLSHGAG